jgi:5-methylcytosine-specific restriction endonuclease McrA
MATPWRDPRTGKRLGSTAYWRRLRLRIFLRDRWICGLCREPINPRLRYPHPRSGQIHHLVSVATLDARNLVAAHKECNFRAARRESLTPSRAS